MDLKIGPRKMQSFDLSLSYQLNRFVYENQFRKVILQFFVNMNDTLFS